MNRFASESSNRCIRVVHVAQSMTTGGLERLLVEFARHGDRDRFDQLFISLGSRGTVADAIETHGRSVIALHEPEGFRWTLPLKLRKLLRNWKADVVHTHNTKPLIYAGPAARMAGVSAVIHTRHGRPLGANHRAGRVFINASRFASRVVGVSQDCTDASHADGVDPTKLTTILNGIDLDRFTFTGPMRHGNVVMVAALTPKKGTETLLHAAALLQNHGKFRMQIAGDGPSLPSLRVLADQLKLGQCLQFLGEVADVPDLLSRARLVVLPSLTEGIPLTLLEAMGRGLPVVATSVGGTPEVVSDGETGLLVPPQNPEALATAIAELLNDDDRSRSMGAAGRRRAEAKFDIRRMVSDYEQLYLECLTPNFTSGSSEPRLAAVSPL